MKQLIGIYLFALICSNGNTQYFYYNNKYHDKNIITEFGILAKALNSITDVGGGVFADVMYQNIIGHAGNQSECCCASKRYTSRRQ